MDILPLLEENLKACIIQRDQTRSVITKTQDDLKGMYAKSPKRPRSSMTEIDKNLVDLENQRTRNSLSLTEEKQLLKQIYAGEREKRQLQERLDFDKMVDTKKAEIQALRDSLQPLLDRISDLEKVLSKARLASKLECSMEEMQKEEMTCPGEKIGRVIGKNGAMMKRIAEKANVSLDVDTKKNIIVIHGGSAESLAIAKQEIDKVIMATEEELELPQEMILYLTTNTTGAMSLLRESYPDLHMDVARNSTKFIIRGQPDQAAKLKESMQTMGIVRKERKMTGAEAVLVIGKKGANVEKITARHKVAIEVQKKTDDESLAIVAGTSAEVDAAMKEINDIIADNAEVTKLIPCGKVVVQGFLTANGVKIKELQKKISESTRELGAGSVLLSFDNASGDNSNLVIKGRNAAIGTAAAMVGEAIREIDTSTVRIMADLDTIPLFIGKGGENIKKLKGDKIVNIEVNKTTGEIAINGLNQEEVAEVEAKVLKVIAENKVEKIPVDPAVVDLQYRELVRSTKVRTEVTDLVKLDLDKAQSAIVLRGTDENVHKAAGIVKAFLDSNYVEDFEITDADRDALLAGGQESKIVAFAKELEVHLSTDRETSTIHVKGLVGKVKAAVTTIKAYLFGGEGNTCIKIEVAEEALGLVIGKGGKVRKSLEAKYAGVSLYIHRTNDAITIRGPEEEASNCRYEVLKLIASGRVTQDVSATEEQVEAMQKNNLMRRITQNIPVQCTIDKMTCKVRGFAPDVKDAVVLLKEHLTGVYESSIDLGHAQFAKIKGASRDESHFARMKESTGVEISLNESKNAVVVTGKKNSVKKAKFQLFDFLEFLVPGEFRQVKLPKPMQASVGQATALIDIAASTGTMICLDRDVSMIIIQSSDKDHVTAAIAQIQAKIAEAEKLVYVFEFDASDAWLIPMIIGKNGSHVNSIRKQSGCTIEVSKEERTVLVSGTTEEAVVNAKSSIQLSVDKAQKENVYVEVPGDAMARFVGRGGTHISGLKSKYEVEIETSKKGSVRITGSEENVQLAKKAVDDWVLELAKPEEKKEVQIQRHHIAPILGKQGANIQAMQEEFGCRIDMDRENLIVTFRGDPGNQELALRRIEEIMAETPAPLRKATSVEEAEDSNNAPVIPDAETPKKSENSAKKPVEAVDPDEQVDRTREFPQLPVGVRASIPKKRRQRKSQGTSASASSTPASSPTSVVSPSKTMASSSADGSSVSDEDEKIVARFPASDTIFVNISA